MAALGILSKVAGKALESVKHMEGASVRWHSYGGDLGRLIG